MVQQAYFDKLKKIESGGNPLAENPKSSAKGLFQFIDSTGKQYGLDKYQFGTPEYTKAETEAAIQFTQDNYNSLQKSLGRKPTNGELYLAHQQGADAAAKLLKAGNKRAVDVLGRDQVLLNGGTEEMTASQFVNKWTGKFAELDEQSKDVSINALADFGIDFEPEGLSKKINALSDFGINLDGNEIKASVGLSKNDIDAEKGAAPWVRAVVGSVQKPEDRLSTLQQYYPDAQPYDDDNFIYTDPETGKVTLYNPKGLDMGDVSSIAREYSMTLGSAMGAVAGGGTAIVAGQLGPQVLTPEEVATVPAGVIIGSGLGAGIAANAFDGLMNMFGLRVDTRKPSEMFTQTAVEVGAAGAGEVIGPMLAPAAKSAIGGAKATTQKVIQAFDRLGITPTMATTGSKGAARTQASLAQNAFAVKQIEETSAKQLKQIHKAANQVISKFGQAKTKQGAGEVIREAAKKSAEAFREKQTIIYDEVFDQIENTNLLPFEGADILRADAKSKIGTASKSLKPLYKKFERELSPRFSVENVKSLRNFIESKINEAPKSLGDVYKGIMRDIDNIIADAGDGGIKFSALREIRTSIGKRMDEPSLVDSGSLAQSQLKMLYGAITLDISKAAADVSDDAAAKLINADNFTKTFMQTAAKTLEKINKFDADERAYNFAISAAKDGGTALSILRKNFSPEEWDVVSASTLRRLGNPLKDGEFSVSQFLNNYKKLAPEAKAALFGGKRYAEARRGLDDLIIALESLKDVEKYANASQTAGAMQMFTYLDALGGGVGGLLSSILGAGESAAPATLIATGLTAAGRQLAPKTAAKLITNEKFIRWLADPVKQGTVDATKHIAKLYAIAEADDQLKDAIYEYSDILSKNSGSGE